VVSGDASRGDERAVHLIRNTLHRTIADANFAGDLDDAHTGPQTIMDALFRPSVLPASTARFTPKRLPAPSPVSVENNDQLICVEKPSQNSASDDQ
jgi:hypothetical protein